MRITGDHILQSALETVTGERPTGASATDDLDVIARRSQHVIDSANLSPGILGERTQAYCVHVPVGSDRFLWGPTPRATENDAPPADVFDPSIDATEEQRADRKTDPRYDLLPPSEVLYWTWQDGDYEIKVTPDGRLTSLNEWLDRDFIGSGGWPRMLYWQRNLNAAQQAVFLFAPEADQEYQLNLYARVPALDRVERGRTYDLPQGLAAYLIALLAIDACQPFRTMPRPDMYAALKSAERGLQRVPAAPQAMATSPDWLNLDGRAPRSSLGFWGR